MSILVINAGSSSLKFALFDAGAERRVVFGRVQWTDGNSAVFSYRCGAEQHEQPVEATSPACVVPQVLQVIERATESGLADPVEAVGHRMIHAGCGIDRPVLIDGQIKQRIEQYAFLAPLHIPAALGVLQAVEERWPSVPQVAVFDSAFFARLPEWAFLYAVPYEWYSKWGIRRIGYHGISHQYCTHRAGELLGKSPEQLRLIICHLGQGCSATAVEFGRPIMNTLGFSSVDGLVMGTRSGSVDPGIILHMIRRVGLSPAHVEELLYNQSGLLGISGISADCRVLEQAAKAGNLRAKLALEVFVKRIQQTIGGLVALLGGMDAVVITGGIGENSPWLRSRIFGPLQCLGLKLDDEKNRQARPDIDIAAAESRGRILLVESREDVMIARQTREVVS